MPFALAHQMTAPAQFTRSQRPSAPRHVRALAPVTSPGQFVAWWSKWLVVAYVAQAAAGAAVGFTLPILHALGVF